MNQCSNHCQCVTALKGFSLNNEHLKEKSAEINIFKLILVIPVSMLQY